MVFTPHTFRQGDQENLIKDDVDREGNNDADQDHLAPVDLSNDPHIEREIDDGGQVEAEQFREKKHPNRWKQDPKDPGQTSW